MLWRRSYDVPPPPIEPGDEFAQFDDPRCTPTCRRSSSRRPSASRTCWCRTLPYWYDEIVPDLRAGKTVLVAAHGNSLRAIVKHLDQVSDDAIAKLNIPTGIPLRYDLDDDLHPGHPGRGSTSTRRPAAAGAAAVANQGR